MLALKHFELSVFDRRERFFEEVKLLDTAIDKQYVLKNDIITRKCTSQFQKMSVRNQKRVMNRIKDDIHKEYRNDCELNKEVSQKKSNELLHQIISPWHSDQHFDFSKYKKQDFDRINYGLIEYVPLKRGICIICCGI